MCPKWGYLTPSAFLISLQGNWMLTNLCLFPMDRHSGDLHHAEIDNEEANYIKAVSFELLGDGTGTLSCLWSGGIEQT